LFPYTTLFRSQIAATLPKARILLAPNTLTSCFEPPQGNAAERTLTYEEPRRSPPPRIWAFSRPSFVPHTKPGPAAGSARGRRIRAPLLCLPRARAQGFAATGRVESCAP